MAIETRNNLAGSFPMWKAAVAFSSLACGLLSGPSVLAVQPLTVASSEYRLVSTQVGDQSKVQLAFSSKGGFAVWHDNATDRDGLGISARRFTSISSGAFSAFPVNTLPDGDQENPQVALFSDGGAIFIWQSGANGGQHIRGRIIRADGVFAGDEFLISQSATTAQIEPSVAVFPDGSFVVSYSSWAQDGEMSGVYAQRLSRAGLKMGSEFRLNQETRLNQRSSATTTLSDGRILVTWISEGQNAEDSVDVYARFISATGNVQGSEFLLNSTKDTCANPSVSPLSNGGFMAAWSVHHATENQSDWNVYARAFKADGTAAKPEQLLNTFTSGSQYAPKLSGIGSKTVAVWTSFGQDGMQEGVFGQVLNSDGSHAGDEMQVNTTPTSRQVTPVVSTDGQQSVVVAWSSFTGVQSSFDLIAQRYTLETLVNLPTPGAPWAAGLGPKTISVSWPEVLGVKVASYTVVVDGATQTPFTTTGLVLSITNPNWLPQSTHSFKLGYVDVDGNASSLSSEVIGKTWGVDANQDGLPDDWQRDNWGSIWPTPTADEDLDGANNLQEFLAGTNPRDPQSSLRTSLLSTQAGMRLQWGTQAGSVYQVQSTVDLNVWNDSGPPRFAAGQSDSVPTPAAADVRYYRVLRLR